MKDADSTPRSDRKPRLPANDRVRIEGFSGAAWTINWSSTGFLLLTEDMFLAGDSVRVDFPDRYASGIASVIWARHLPDGCLVGFELQTLDRRVIRS